MLKNQSYKAVRNYSGANVNRFRTCLSEINWSDLLSDQDPQAAYNKFHSKYSSLYEECFPWKKRSKKQKNILFSPWIILHTFRSKCMENQWYDIPRG